jgi:hypothetical protein
VRTMRAAPRIGRSYEFAIYLEPFYGGQ